MEVLPAAGWAGLHSTGLREEKDAPQTALLEDAFLYFEFWMCALIFTYDRWGENCQKSPFCIIHRL